MTCGYDIIPDNRFISPEGISMFGRKKTEKAPVKSLEGAAIRSVKECFDKNGWKYELDEKNNKFTTGFMGDDLPISVVIVLNDISMNIVCLLDFQAVPEKFSDVVWNLNEINRNLPLGLFSLNPEDGYISFSYAHFFPNHPPAPEFVEALIGAIVETVDQNDGNLKKIAEVSGNRAGDYNMMYN